MANDKIMLWLSGPFINQLQLVTLSERGERMVPFGPSTLTEHGAAFEPVFKVENWNSFSVIYFVYSSFVLAPPKNEIKSFKREPYFSRLKLMRRSLTYLYRICNYNSKFLRSSAQ